MDKLKKIPVVIDCDPGTDDIFALMMARQIANLDVRAITAVAGNVTLENTRRNALRVAAFTDWDVPVAAGAERPLACRLVTAEEVHGANGMHGLSLPETDRTLSSLPAWDVIYNEAKKCGELTLIAVGPFTNVALAIKKYPDLKQYVSCIVVMGGAFFSGNTTPATEFNVAADPEAAQIVMLSGIPVYMCPLELTHKAYITAEEIEQVRALGSPQAEFLAEVTHRAFPFVSRYSEGLGVPLHDPCAVLFAADDSLFTYEQCSIVVETRGLITRGRTVTDLWSDRQMGLNNGYMVHDIDRTAFIARVMELMGKY